MTTTLLVVVWVVLSIVLIATAYEAGLALLLGRGLAVILMLYVLALAEGLEIAIARRLSNHDNASQVGALLHGLNNSRFFAQRQISVVAIIAMVTLLLSFPTIHVPFIGGFGAPISGLITFAWVTLTVLWLAQVGPKLLALDDPDSFIVQARWLLHALRRFGHLIDLTGPVNFFFPSLKRPRRLDVGDPPCTCALCNVPLFCGCSICTMVVVPRRS
jgi:hypothetical protein